MGADEALPAGTRLRVEPHGEGTYERWGKNLIGANDHFVRFASGVEMVQLKKLGAQAWHVVPDEPGLAAEPEPEPSPAAPGAADAAPAGRRSYRHVREVQATGNRMRGQLHLLDGHVNRAEQRWPGLHVLPICIHTRGEDCGLLNLQLLLHRHQDVRALGHAIL